MTTTVLSKLGFLTPTNHASATDPQIAPAARLQEQFTGSLPLREERTMAEILAERLAKSDPARPAPLFIP